MKPYSTLIFIAILMIFSNELEAQIFKKLKKKIEDKVEETVVEKSSDEAAKKTDKSLDKIFNPDFGSKETKSVEKEDLPAYFDFKYKYQLHYTSNNSKSEMTIDYFLKPGATYLGTSTNVGAEMIMVMDGKDNTSYMFMNSEGYKFCKATSLDVSGNFESDQNVLENYTITTLPNKTFLGYDCKGTKMENDDYRFIIYFTNEADVSFNDVFKTDQSQIPESMKSFFENNKNALMMYMDMKDKKNKGRKNASGIMECTLLEPTDFKIKTSEYKFM